MWLQTELQTHDPEPVMISRMELHQCILILELMNSTLVTVLQEAAGVLVLGVVLPAEVVVAVIGIIILVVLAVAFTVGHL